MSLQWKRRQMMITKEKKKGVDETNKLLTDEDKDRIRKSSYLGKKGYTIPLELLPESEIAFLKKDLFVKAESMGASYGQPGDPNEGAFPVYRENSKKIYIPRFYGCERYGLPDRSEITTGEDICVNFPKALRDYQDTIVDVYMKHVNKPICSDSKLIGNGGILEVPCGRGKCLGKNTPILMFDGTIKLVQHICVGDVLMGDDSTPRNVLTLARGQEMMYKVNSSNKEGYIVNESHILSLKYTHNEKQVDMSVAEYIKHIDQEALYGYRVPIHFPKAHLRTDPYTMGVQLCDDIVNQHERNIRIPHEYKCNTRDIRLRLLAGIIDYDGYYYDHKYNLICSHEGFSKDIVYVARSLGFLVETQSIVQGRGDSAQILYTVSIRGNGLHEIPVKNTTAKAPIVPSSPFNNLLYPIQLEPVGIDDYYGFEIDGNRRFVLGDFTVTHNTVMALKIISLVQKKTLIVVHKEFLMNQWIERAAEFLPGAKIGRIQGSTFDVDGKDIVIGMLQTLYDRALPENAFDCFGLTIVDEVHRIGSEQFSKTLLRVVSPNMLGISATVDRKDKLTKVLYMFIGPKIYSEARETDDPVCVRAIEYISSDPHFNETEYDFRGQAKYSTMISKLSDYGPRSDFIVRVLGDLIKEGQSSEIDTQIMVLCHNRSLLKYLYEAIIHRGFASVGYYVGGMKQSAL